MSTLFKNIFVVVAETPAEGEWPVLRLLPKFHDTVYISKVKTGSTLETIKKTISDDIKSKSVKYEDTCVVFAPCHTSLKGDFYFGGKKKIGKLIEILSFLIYDTHSFTRVHLHSCNTGLLLMTRHAFLQKNISGCLGLSREENENLFKDITQTWKTFSILLSEYYRFSEKISSLCISGFGSAINCHETSVQVLGTDNILFKRGLPISKRTASKCKRAGLISITIGKRENIKRCYYFGTTRSSGLHVSLKYRKDRKKNEGKDIFFEKRTSPRRRGHLST